MIHDADPLPPARHYSLSRDPAPLPNRIETAGDLNRWTDERSRAAAALRQLEHTRKSLLKSATVEQLTKHDAAIGTAKLRLERAAAVCSDAQATFDRSAAETAAAQPARRKAHKAGLEAQREAERLIREEYAPAAVKIAGVLDRLIELQAIVKAADAALPEESSRLGDIERFRGDTEYLSFCLRHSVVLPGVTLRDSKIWPIER